MVAKILIVFLKINTLTAFSTALARGP